MRLTLFALLLAVSAAADTVTNWNRILRTTTAAEGSQTQARFAAITHLAIFEAVNAITLDHEPYLRSISAP